MKPLSIFLVRHGESLGNVDKSVYSKIPDWKIPLTDKGIEQAKEAGVKLSEMIKRDDDKYRNNLLTYYCSPWYRARQTAQYLRETLEPLCGVGSPKFREDPRIREQEWGNYQDEGFIKSIRKERLGFGSFFYRFPHGESGADVYDRVTTFIDTMYRDFADDHFSANAIIISHGLAIKAFLMRWFHWSVEDFDKYDTPDNCEIVQMELQKNKKYKLITELKLNPKL